MTNQHRVTKLIASLVLVAGCGSKETAEPQKERASKHESAATSGGTGTAEDCVKAKAEVERLMACQDELDEDMLENMKELDKSLNEPNVPADVKAMIMDQCKHSLAQMAGMHCGNIKKKAHRRRAADSDE